MCNTVVPGHSLASKTIQQLNKVGQKRKKCLPLLCHGGLIGVLYIHVFLFFWGLQLSGLQLRWLILFICLGLFFFFLHFMIFSVVGAVVVGGGSFKCAINIDLCEKPHVCIQITGGERE